ncbi:methyl-accepting chemotaxis protein [Comamonas sp. GB3 AK4-5]|uniref:methyl-accepting chemotaxis protein n=1 Tax=Comamonas sp. GB3 AK4-5 TaxID=3231487 RepID=UPI00351F801F
MQWLNKLSIRVRLYLGTLFSVVMLLLVGGVGYGALTTTHLQVQDMFSNKVQVLSQMEEVRNRLAELRLLEKGIIISANNTTQVQELRERWTGGMTALRTRLQELQQSPGTPSDMALNLESGITYLEDYAKAMNEVFGKVEDALMDSMAAAAYADNQRSTIEGMDSVLTTTAENARTDMEFTRRAVEEAGRKMGLWLGVLLMVAVAVLLPTTYFGVRAITRALADAQALAQRIAEGDLTQNVQVRQRDELGQLMLSMDRMQQSLRTLVQQVQQASGQVSVASGEIAGGNANLSERTEQTASHLEQTARAMGNLGQEVRHSAQASAQAREQADSAASVAAQGGQAVDSVVQTMSEITASAHRIGEITSVIDAIAFQTNILALNAAVEAARAGEQGRGFAVVAGEVRVLAQRSAEAAKQIKQLTGDSVRCADSGSAQVARAGQTMQAIVSSVERVATTIAEVSRACEVQDRQIGEVSASVADLEQMTQQNAALVEESAAASSALREQAYSLDGAVRRFVMPGGTALLALERA